MSNLKYFLLNGYQEYNHLMMGGAALTSPIDNDEMLFQDLVKNIDDDSLDKEAFEKKISMFEDQQSINKYDDEGYTLLHILIMKLDQGNMNNNMIYDMIQIALKNGADPHIEDTHKSEDDEDSNDTPFDIFMASNCVFHDILTESQCKSNIKNILDTILLFLQKKRTNIAIHNEDIENIRSFINRANEVLKSTGTDIPSTVDQITRTVDQITSILESISSPPTPN